MREYTITRNDATLTVKGNWPIGMIAEDILIAVQSYGTKMTAVIEHATGFASFVVEPKMSAEIKNVARYIKMTPKSYVRFV
jgi:hypothetical protein